MSQITVKTGSAAFIEVEDPAIIQDIYARISSNQGVPPAVQLRPEALTIALVFDDQGEVELSVAGFLPDLEAVTQAGGKLLVTARRPAAPQAGGGGLPPVDPPPPDTLCPCGGP